MLRWILLAAALAAAHPASADAIARTGRNWVLITLKPCTDAQVVAVLTQRGEHPDAFRAASAHYGGVDYAACWKSTDGGADLIYEDGDDGFVETVDLKALQEI